VERDERNGAERMVRCVVARSWVGQRGQQSSLSKLIY
jgi:hypothetical protein